MKRIKTVMYLSTYCGMHAESIVMCHIFPVRDAGHLDILLLDLYKASHQMLQLPHDACVKPRQFLINEDENFAFNSKNYRKNSSVCFFLRLHRRYLA